MARVSRVEVIQTGARRRWSGEEKLRIVAECESGPRQVSATARRYGLLPSQLFYWRRLAREGRLGGSEDSIGFAAAVIACDREARGVPWARSAVTGRMEIALGNGIRVIVDKDVDGAALARVIGAILQR